MKSHLGTEKIKTSLNKPIVLTGMMGTGKSHIGKSLAEMLDIPFYDSDQIIEERGGITINEIFELYGEEKFRVSEARVIEDLLDKGTCVIATGGGALTTPSVLEAVKENSISVWLKTDIPVLMKRLEQAKNRPLLKQADPEAVLRDLLKKREHLYAQMDIAVETHENDINQTLDALVNALTYTLDSM